MSKEITDLLGRLNGDMLALQGMEQRLAPPLPAPPPTFDQAASPPPPPAKPKKEDYDYVKKLAGEIKGLCTSLEEQVDKELKVPPLPGDEAKENKEASHTTGGTSGGKK